MDAPTALAPAGAPSSRLTPDDLIPDVLRAHPQLRVVFDRYGLKGCGGELGPQESLGFFARAHGVALDKLMADLHASLAQPAPAPAAYEPGPGDTIYKLFFKGGIAVVLTAGAVWGALLLLKIGYSQQFTVNSIFSVNAHGHAMIFGWVGLFVMGFAYQAFPRFKHTELFRPCLARATFWLMAAGILLRVICEPLHDRSPLFFHGAIAACALEIYAIGTFVYILLKTFARSGKPYEVHDRYILAALFFFVLQAFWDLGLLWTTTTAPSGELLLARVAAYQAPLRDFQIHGFATLMILGVSQRFLPGIYGFQEPSKRLSAALLAPLVLAILAEGCFFVLMVRTGHAMEYGIALYAAMLAFGGIVTALALDWKVFKTCEAEDRSLKFLRTGFGWLLVSVAMLVAMPLYLRWYSGVHGHGFSHAYYGATRHAITVGFITLMILGVASKVVPTLAGADAAKLTALWPTFVLVNTGCAMRVFFQILTDVPSIKEFAYPVAGISGVLEVTGIALWGAHLWSVMNGRHSAELQAAPDPAKVLRIEESMKVATVLDLFPATLGVFVAYGFDLLENPFLRKTLARNVSVKQAAGIKGVDLTQLLQALNGAAYPASPAPGREALKREGALPT